MNVSRFTTIGVILVPLFCLGKGSKETCGTYPERVKEELFLSRQNLERRELAQVFRKLSGLAAIEEAKGAVRDAGDIALIEEDSGIVSRRNLFNLHGKLVRYVPSGSGYRVELGTAEAGDGEQGTAIEGLGDDDTRSVALPFSFSFFGRAQKTLYVNSDGNVSFEEGDGSTRERSLGRLVSGQPRVAGLFLDLDPSRAGRVIVISRADRVIVKWLDVPEYTDSGTGPLNTFQIRLFATGVIEVVYDAIASVEGVVGIAPGRLEGGSSFVNLGASDGQNFTAAIAERFSSVEELDLVTAAQRFYETHEDAYDYLVFYNAIGVTAGSGTVAYESTVRNQRSGYGDQPIEAGSEYGSQRRLQAVMNMGPVSQYPVDPNGILNSRFSSRDTPITVLAHEAGHLFLAFASVTDPNNSTSRPMLGRQTAHWSFVFNSEASLLEGNRIEDKGAGASPRFETVAVTEGYSPLDQYLMGFRPKEEVPPTFYVSGATVSTLFGPPPQLGVRFNGVRRDVTVDDLIGAVGTRIPDASVSQKKFRFGFVLIVPRGGSVNQAVVDQVDSYRRGFESYYFRAAGERASAEASLKQSVALSLWPASGVVAGQSTTASLKLSRTSAVARTFALRAQSALVEIPSLVTVPAGQSSVTFSVRGLRSGVDVIEVSPGDPAYENVEARVQVLSSVNSLALELVSGGNQLAANEFLPAPVVLKVMDANRLPYPGIRVSADPGMGGRVEPSIAVSDENGLVQFRWKPDAAPLNRLAVSVTGGPRALVTSLGRPYLLASSVVNGASFSGGLTPLSIHSIFGANLAGGVRIAASIPWPGRINGVEVLVNGRPQPLIFVSDSQINFYLADQFSGLTEATVQVVTPLGESVAVKAPIKPVSPGIFPGAVLRRGEFLEVYGTGLGPVVARDGFQTVAAPVEAVVNGVSAEVLFAGLAPGYVGLYQVNLRMPNNAAGGLRVKLRVAGVESNELQMP